MNHQYHQPILPLSLFQFNFSVATPISLPKYPGSAWRGAFGNALKKTVCIVRNTPCGDCLLQNSCAYPYIFETPPPLNAEKMRKYNAAPHPFVLQLADSKQLDNRVYTLCMILFGHGQRFFPYVVYALQKAGNEGIGGNRQIFTLQTIEQITASETSQPVYEHGKLNSLIPPTMPNIPPMPDRIKLAIHTPMRIKQDSKNIHAAHFGFAAFFGNLLRRISMLTYFHTDTPLETGFAELMQQARRVEFADKKLDWYDWTRYSSRQQTEMQMGGVTGSLELEMQGLEAFWPYLWLGQWTHAGKGTSMGMGRYTIEADDANWT